MADDQERKRLRRQHEQPHRAKERSFDEVSGEHEASSVQADFLNWRHVSAGRSLPSSGRSVQHATLLRMQQLHGNAAVARSIAKTRRVQRRADTAHVGGEEGQYTFVAKPGGATGDTLAPGEAGYSRQMLSGIDDAATLLSGNYADMMISQVAPSLDGLNKQVALRAEEKVKQADKMSSWWGEDVSWNRSYREAAEWCQNHANDIRNDGASEESKIAQYNAWVPRANGFYTSLTRLDAIQDMLGVKDPRSMASALITGLQDAQDVALRAQLAHDQGRGETLDVPAVDDTVAESADEATLAAQELNAAYLGFQQNLMSEEMQAIDALGGKDRERMKEIEGIKKTVRTIGKTVDVTMAVVSGAPTTIANARSAVIRGEASLNAYRNKKQIVAGKKPTHNPTYVTTDAEGNMVIRNVQTGMDTPAAGGAKVESPPPPDFKLPASVEDILGGITDFVYYDEVKEINQRLEQIKSRCDAVENSIQLTQIKQRTITFQTKLNVFAKKMRDMQARIAQRRQAYLEFGVQLDNFARKDAESRTRGQAPGANEERFATIMVAVSAVREVLSIGNGALDGFDTPDAIETWALDILYRRRRKPPRTDIRVLSMPDEEWEPLDKMYGQTARTHFNIGQLKEIFGGVDSAAKKMIEAVHQGGGNGSY